MSALLGVCSALGGCQVNMVLLEMLGAHSSSGYYALTFLHYVAVSVLALPLLLQWRRRRPEEWAAGVLPIGPCGWRQRRLLRWQRGVLAVWSWAVTVSNNVAFAFSLSIPVHATCRSSSLLMNLLAGYLLLGRRFTLPQVLAAFTVCAGLVVLTAHKAQRQHSGASGKGQDEAEADTFRWLCGVMLLLATTAVMALMSVFQEYIFRAAQDRDTASAVGAGGREADERLEQEPPAVKALMPLWAEGLFFSHALGVPLFFSQPQRLLQGLIELQSAPPGLLTGNCITQFICIAGVFVLSEATSAFNTALVLSLRKLITFGFSIVFFQHYRYLTWVEWVAMAAALAAATAYPFLPSSKGRQAQRGARTTEGSPRTVR